MVFDKMRSLNLLIKPSSCNCNLRCKYCFYFDVAENRNNYTFGNMSYETLENMVKNVFNTVTHEVTFMFQGGEPLLRGISFYNKLHEYIEKYNKDKIKVNFSVQTNGTLLNDKWINLFKKYNYLLGVSIDGTKDIHDIFRIDIRQKGTFDSILNNINKLRENNIDFNILTVINSEVSKNAKKIYDYYKLNNFKFLQFIPCLDPLSYDEKDFSLTAKDYGVFLDELFNLWYEDLKNNDYVSVRYFENLILILLGKNPEACDMMGRCSVNVVVEADGSIYPCDFYVLDDYRIGNINSDKIVDIVFSEKALKFVRDSIKFPEKCSKCKYLKICRTGCKRHKDKSNYNKFCESYIYFLDRNLKKLLDVRDNYLDKI